MAPKRGLAASKKAAKAVAVTPVEPTTQLFPEDGLTINDLFELKQSVSTLLTTPEDEATAGEEARGLLRGILHGCEGLVAVVTTTEEASRLTALGLNSPLSEAKLLYLQAFALHEMSSILPPPLSAVSLSSAAGGSTQKRRKVDLSEPTSPLEWLELALEKYQSAEAVTKDCLKWEGFMLVEWARALLDRAVIEMLKKNFESGKKFIKELEIKIELATKLLTDYKPSSILYDEEDCDLATALLRLLSLFVSLLDNFAASETTSLEEHLHSLDIVTKAVACTFINPSDEATEFWDAENRTAARKVEVNILRADALMASFSMREVAITKKYRGVDGDDEDDEGDVTPLPMEVDVIEARKVGKQAIEALELVMTNYDLLEPIQQTVALKTTQCMKLQEAYMTYEALLNDEDEDEFEFTSLGFESARTRAGFAGDQKNESFVAEEGDGDDGEDGEDDEDEDDE